MSTPDPAWNGFHADPGLVKLAGAASSRCGCGKPVREDIGLTVLYRLDGNMQCADGNYCSVRCIPQANDYLPADAEILEVFLQVEEMVTTVTDQKVKITEHGEEGRDLLTLEQELNGPSLRVDLA